MPDGRGSASSPDGRGGTDGSGSTDGRGSASSRIPACRLAVAGDAHGGLGEEEIEEAMREVRPALLRDRPRASAMAAVAWGDLIEIGQVKRSLHTFVVDALSERRKFVRLGIEPPRGVLLYGPPGTGKTALATGFVTCHMSLATYCNVSSRLPYCVSRVTYR